MSAIAAERSQPRAFWAAAFFVATELTLLGCVVGSYFYLRFKAPQWPPAGIPEPKVLLPCVLAAVLLATSVPVQLAYSAGKRGRAATAFLALLAATVVQAGWLAMQIHLFRDDLSHFVPQQDAYASIYYVLAGADHFHVAVGLLLDCFLLAKLAGGLTRYRVAGLQAGAFYWHFVNAATVLLTLVQISPSL